MTATADCATLAPLYARRLLGTLDEDELDRVEGHLASCAVCPQTAGDLEATLESLNVPLHTAPRGVWERLDAELAAAPPQAQATVPVSVALTCTYCHGRLMAAGAAYCATCLTPHHPGCFEEHGRCCAPGCDSTLLVNANPVARPARASRGASPLTWVAAGLFGAAAAWTFAGQLRSEGGAALPPTNGTHASSAPTAPLSSPAGKSGPTFQGKTADEWIEKLRDYDELYREQAARALGEIGAPALPDIDKALVSAEPQLRSGALVCVREMRSRENLSPAEANRRACAALGDPNERVRSAALDVLVRQGADLAPTIVVFLRADDADVRTAALVALRGLHGSLDDVSLDAVAQRVGDASGEVRSEALRILWERPAESVGPPVARQLEPERSPEARRAALDILASLKGSLSAATFGAVIGRLADSETPVIVAAARVVVLKVPKNPEEAWVGSVLEALERNASDEVACPGLVEALVACGEAFDDPPKSLELALLAKSQSEHAPVRRAALSVLGKMRSPAARAALWRGLEDSDEDVRLACAKRLAKGRDVVMHLPQILDAHAASTRSKTRDHLVGLMISARKEPLRLLDAEAANTVVNALRRGLHDSSVDVRRACLNLLQDVALDDRIHERAALGRSLASLLSVDHRETRRGATIVLRKLGAYALADTASIFSALSSWRSDRNELRPVIYTAPRERLGALPPALAREAIAVASRVALDRAHLKDIRRSAVEFLSKGCTLERGIDDAVANRARLAAVFAQGLELGDRELDAEFAQGLYEIGPAALDQIPALLKALRRDPNGALGRHIGNALGERSGGERPPLAQALAARPDKGQGALRQLAAALSDSSAEVRLRAADSLRRAGWPGNGPDCSTVVPQLLAALKREPKSAVASVIAQAVGWAAPRGHDEAVEALLERFKRKEVASVREACLEALSRVAGAMSFELARDVIVLSLTSDVDSSTRRSAAVSLGRLVAAHSPYDEHAAAALLETLSNDVDAPARSFAARSLGTVGVAVVSQRKEAFLVRIEAALTKSALEDSEDTVRRSADNALRQIRRRRAELKKSSGVPR